MKSGIATFSLDYGKCPRWLFERMTKLAEILIEAIVIEFGPTEFLKRISDPVWFQSFGCLLAFDWNSSGLTVTTTAAIKRALSQRNWDLEIYVCGGKGKSSLRTPQEIDEINSNFGYNNNFKEISKIVAKIDNTLVQDGFSIYHHSFFFDSKGNWVVIQQGMNTQFQLARRYHWIGNQKTDMENFLSDYQKIACNIKMPKVLNLASKDSSENRNITLKIIKEKDPLKEIKALEIILDNKKHLFKHLYLPNLEFKYHPVLNEKLDFKKIRKFILESVNKLEGKGNKISFIDILKTNMGPKTIRALSLAAEVIYGAVPSYKDPARYSFAHGGKDGTPYFVDIQNYDKTIEVLKRAIRLSKVLSYREKTGLLLKLEKF